MNKPSSTLNEDDMLAQLDSVDAEGGINQHAPDGLRPEVRAALPKQKSLGKLASHVAAEQSEISMANDTRWKVIPYSTLPSFGMFYPDDAEISIRSANVTEIRHWSTIDENDMISVNDCLNFILEKCLRFKIKGRPVLLSWRDLNMIDRLFLIFKIHEITFPNGENKLMKTFECESCPIDARYSGKHQVRGAMLQNFTVPDELKDFYHKEYRTFFIESNKIGSFYLNMPTVGGFNLVKDYITRRSRMGKDVDKWFVTIAPYLIEDYQSMTVEALEKLQMETNDWHENKTYFVTSAVDMLEKAKNNKLVIKCPKCNANIEADIFSKFSFTVKNLFFISARLKDLI